MIQHYPGIITEKEAMDLAKKIVKFMDDYSLLASMFPEENEENGYWYISFSDERGNSEDEVSFDTEYEALKVSEKVFNLIEERD